jgi:hypothetical protein
LRSAIKISHQGHKDGFLNKEIAESTKIQRKAENGFEQEETEQTETQAKKGYRTSPGGKILCCLCYLLFKSFFELCGGNATLIQGPEGGFVARRLQSVFLFSGPLYYYELCDLLFKMFFFVASLFKSSSPWPLTPVAREFNSPAIHGNESKRQILSFAVGGDWSDSVPQSLSSSD